MFTSNIKHVTGGLFVCLTLMATVAIGQNRPEFSPEFWAQKRLPDSMKGISPEHLAAMARANDAALKAKNNSQRRQPARRAGGSMGLAASQGSQVIQTGANVPIGSRRPVAGFIGGMASAVRPGARQPAARPAMQVPQHAMQVPQHAGQLPQQRGGLPPVAQASSEVPSLLEQARIAKKNGDLDKARMAYRRILEIEPYNRDVLVQAGRVEHAMGEIDNAIQAYEYLLKIAPNHAVGLNDLGLCHARKGNMDAALKSLQAAVTAEPRSHRYRNNLAKVLIETNQVESAAKVLSQLRGDALGKASVGALLAERGRNDEARNYLEQAVAADPNLVAAQKKLASLKPSATPATRVATQTQEMNPAPMAIQAGANDTQITPPALSLPTPR